MALGAAATRLTRPVKAHTVASHLAGARPVCNRRTISLLCLRENVFPEASQAAAELTRPPPPAKLSVHRQLAEDEESVAERVVGVDGPFRGAGDVGGAGDLVAYAGEAADVNVFGRYGGEGLAGDA